MSNAKVGNDDWATCSAKNTARLKYWAAAWVATTAIVAFGPKLVWDFAVFPTILGVFINLAVGFGMIVANKRYLQGLDEMHQKIFLDAGAFTLGVGLVCGISYEMLEDVKLISYEPEISHLIILMCLTMMVGMILGHRRYR